MKIRIYCLEKQQSTGISSKPCSLARQKQKQLQQHWNCHKIKQTGSSS